MSFIQDVCKTFGPKIDSLPKRNVGINVGGRRAYNDYTMASIRTPAELNEIRTRQARSAVYLKNSPNRLDLNQIEQKERRKEDILRRWDLITKGA